MLLLGWLAMEDEPVITERNAPQEVCVRSALLPERAVAEPLPAGLEHGLLLPDQDLQVNAVDALAAAALSPQLVDADVHVLLQGTEALRLPPAFRRIEAHAALRREALILGDLSLDGPASVPPHSRAAFILRGEARAKTKARVQWRCGAHVLADSETELAVGRFELPLEAAVLPEGRHSVMAEIVCGEQRCFATAEVAVETPPALVVASPKGSSLLAAWLRAQGAVVTELRPEELRSSAEAVSARVLVLDQVPALELAEAVNAGLFERRAVAGRGWVHVPAGKPGELRAEGAKAFAELLPCTELEPPPPPEQEPEPEERKPDTPPDPNARRREERIAPTLGLLLAIDASGSMQGESLRLAKEAAWAAARVLHPEDHVAVIAFNKRAREVLSFTPAGQAEDVKDRIARIQCGGGTDYTAALQLAGDMFEAESFGVKHMILLSDGESEPGRFEALAHELRLNGKMTISTVGCGPEQKARDLSNVAAAGGGKFYPAWSLEEVPQVFTIEAERIIAGSGARHAPRDQSPVASAEPEQPAPREDKPSPPAKPPERKDHLGMPVVQKSKGSFLEGLVVDRLPSITNFLQLEPKPLTTVVLSSGARPILAHGHSGAARVLQWAMPFEDGAHQWGSNREAQRLFVQGVNWCEGRDDSERWRIHAALIGRQVFVHLDESMEDLAPNGQLVLSSLQGEREMHRAPVNESALSVPLPDTGGLFSVQVRDAQGLSVADRPFAVPATEEFARALPDAAGLKRWQQVLALRPSADVQAPTRSPARVPAEERFVNWGLAVICVLSWIAERRASVRWAAEPLP